MIMTNLLLRDIMEKENIDPKKVRLIRHALSDPKCKKYIDNNMVKEYTCVQNKSISKKHDYWMVFISGEGNKAILDSFYKVKGVYPNSLEYMPEGLYRLPQWPHLRNRKGSAGRMPLQPPGSGTGSAWPDTFPSRSTRGIPAP